MENNLALELKVIETFIHKDKQARYKQFVTADKTRLKFIRDLPHFNSFKNEKFEKIKVDEKINIMERLKRLKIDSSKCYIISVNPKLDTRILDTGFALDQIIGYGMGTILVFGDADVVYFEGEGPSDRLISK